MERRVIFAYKAKDLRDPSAEVAEAAVQPIDKKVEATPNSLTVEEFKSLGNTIEKQNKIYQKKVRKERTRVRMLLNLGNRKKFPDDIREQFKNIDSVIMKIPELDKKVWKINELITRLENEMNSQKIEFSPDQQWLITESATKLLWTSLWDSSDVKNKLHSDELITKNLEAIKKELDKWSSILSAVFLEKWEKSVDVGRS